MEKAINQILNEVRIIIAEEEGSMVADTSDVFGQERNSKEEEK